MPPPPIWRDADGRPLPAKPCPRCGTTVPITESLHPAAAVALGWMPCASVLVVKWCGQGEELLPSPWGLLPVLEATGE